MEDKKTVQSIDALIKSFSISDIETRGPIETKPITIWVPVEYKNKYEDLQRVSKQKFGKLLKEIFIKSIEDVSQSA